MTDPCEIGMQKWYVESFIDGAFELRRHQCADAAMQVYGASHYRSRESYYLTMLEPVTAGWHAENAVLEARECRN